jgi:hypothetical protein
MHGAPGPPWIRTIQRDQETASPKGDQEGCSIPASALALDVADASDRELAAFIAGF